MENAAIAENYALVRVVHAQGESQHEHVYKSGEKETITLLDDSRAADTTQRRQLVATRAYRFTGLAERV